MKKKPQDKTKIEPKFYTLEEASAYLRLTEDQLKNLAKKSKIPAIEVEGNLLFPKEKIDEWILNSLPETIEEEVPNPALLKLPLKNFIPRGGVLFISGKKSKDSVLEYLVLKSQQLGCISDPEDFLSCLKQREEMISTATDKGLAFLHTRRRIPKHLLTPFIIVAISKEGLDWGALDGNLTHILFLIAMRHDIIHLKILSQLARMANAGLVSKILEQETEEGVLKVLTNFEKKFPRN